MRSSLSLVLVTLFGVSLVTAQEFEYITGEANYPRVPGFTKPAKGVEWNDPDFNTRVVRLSDRDADGYDRGFMPPLYATMDLFTSNNEEVYLGTTRFHVYGVEGYDYRGQIQPTIERDGIDPEIQADPNDPLAFYYRAWTVLYRYDRRTGQSVVVHDFSNEYPNARRIKVDGQGDPSSDFRYWAFQVTEPDAQGIDRTVDVICYDKEQDRIVGRVSDVESPINRSIRWTSMSPSGRKVLIKYTQSGGRTGVWTYNRDFSGARDLGNAARGHSDRAIDFAGNDVIVYKRGNTIVMNNLDTGERTEVLEIGPNSGVGFHVSGNAYGKPGWALVSCMSNEAGTNDPNKLWVADSIFMLQLKANPIIWRIAHTYDYNEASQAAPQSEYWTEPHANINRAGTHVVWGSNSYDVDGRVETYMAILPPDWDQVLGSGDPPPPPDNRPPSAALAASPNSGVAPLTTTLSCTASDPDGDPLTYDWDFGDGETRSGGASQEVHVYGTAGSFTARCTVSDGQGGTGAATALVRVEAAGGEPPPAPTGLRVKR